MAAPFFVLNIAHFRWIKKLPVKTPQTGPVRPGNGLVIRDAAKARLALSPFSWMLFRSSRIGIKTHG